MEDSSSDDGTEIKIVRFHVRVVSTVAVVENCIISRRYYYDANSTAVWLLAVRTYSRPSEAVVHVEDTRIADCSRIDFEHAVLRIDVETRLQYYRCHRIRPRMACRAVVDYYGNCGIVGGDTG